MNRYTFFAAMAFLIAGGAVAQDNTSRGAELANELCVSCHDIGPEGANKTYPPSFASIAKFRDQDQIWARIMFPSLHNSMGGMSMMLLPGQVDQLVAYIQSLE